MKSNFIKYFTTVLLISIFTFKGLVPVCSGLFVTGKNDVATEKLLDTETENGKKNKEDRVEQEPKDPYLGNDCSPGILEMNFSAAEQARCDRGFIYQQSVHISIPKPPPKRL